jgi:putative copper resistance protein D
VHPLGLLGDMLHLCAAGGWIGGLVPLTVFLVHVRSPFSLGETVAPVVNCFSTLSLYCVSVLVVSGISNSWLLVGSIYALFTTLYGRLLLFKLTVFAILISFGIRNRFLVKTKLLKLPRSRTCCLNCIEMCSAKSALVLQLSRSLRVYV